MKLHFVVQDPVTGRTKVLIAQEPRPMTDSGAELRAIRNIERRSRLATICSWVVGLRYLARERETRLRITGLALFFLSACVMPFLFVVAAFLGAAGLSPRHDPERDRFITMAALSVATVSLLLLIRMRRK